MNTIQQEIDKLDFLKFVLAEKIRNAKYGASKARELQAKLEALIGEFE